MRAISLVAVAVSFGLLACGGKVPPAETVDGEEAEAEASEAAASTNNTFKLYEQPNGGPTAECDLFTSLTLTTRRAVMENKVEGACAASIRLNPDPRTYRLRAAGGSCGSKIYKGTVQAWDGTREITVTDHRARVCEDLVPAAIIVEELRPRRPSPVVTTYYSASTESAAQTTWFIHQGGRQCEGLPWSGAEPSADHAHLGEQAKVVAALAKQGVKVTQIGEAYTAEPMITCAACGCPSSAPRIVIQTDAASALKPALASMGFAPLKNDDAVIDRPVQCGGNPWEGGSQDRSPGAENRKLAEWAAGQGATLEAVALVDSVEPMATCAACQCPRGDTAVALPASREAAAKLRSLGWETAK
jgi:hypothetical protein